MSTISSTPSIPSSGSSSRSSSLNKLALVCLLAVVHAAPGALAQTKATKSTTTTTTSPTSPSTTKSDSVQTTGASTDRKENKDGRKDIDDEITNPGLRAQTGALATWSTQTSFQYVGSSIETPFATTRPRLSAGQVRPDVTRLVGSISVKYRATDYDNLNLGGGVSWVQPFGPEQRGQVENPFLSYSRVYKAFGLQNSSSVSVMKYTTPELMDAEYDWELSAGHTFMRQMGKAFGGLSISYDRQIYSADTTGADRLDGLGFFPFVEYSISEMFQFRTVYWGLRYYTTRGRPSSILHDDIGQSAGIGIIVSRDIYLYPNIQWIWENMRADNTNVAINANINF